MLRKIISIIWAWTVCWMLHVGMGPGDIATIVSPFKFKLSKPLKNIHCENQMSTSSGSHDKCRFPCVVMIRGTEWNTATIFLGKLCLKVSTMSIVRKWTLKLIRTAGSRFEFILLNTIFNIYLCKSFQCTDKDFNLTHIWTQQTRTFCWQIEIF